MKRKREASEEVDEAQPRARSPSVAMSMSPEPEFEPLATEVETTTGRGSVTSTKDNLTPDPYRAIDTLPMMEEPPHKRQRLDMKDAQGAQAGRILGALAATTVAVCWVLGKIGEMSTLGDV